MNLSKKRLIDLADYINGYAFKPAQLGKDGLPVIRIEQLKNPKAIDDHYDGVLPEHNIIDNGDLIFSWSASLFLDIWRHGKSALNQHLFKVVPKPGIDKHFLKYLIEYNLPRLTNAAHGSTMQHITRKELHAFFVEIPEEEAVQNKIAQVITSLNDSIRLYESKLTKQQRIKTGLMQDLLTKGIDEQGNIRSEATHEFKDSPLGRIPVEWSVSPLSEISEKIQDGTHFSPITGGYDYLYLTSKNIRFGHLKLDDVEMIDAQQHEKIYKRCDVKKGDLLITKDGASTGNAALNMISDEFSLLSSVAFIRFSDITDHTSFYLHYWLSPLCQQRVKNAMSGNAITRLTLKKIKDFLVVRPSQNEQIKIAEKIQKSVDQITVLKDKSDKLVAIKLGLMQDLLSGQKDIRQLDLNELTSNLSI